MNFLKRLFSQPKAVTVQSPPVQGDKVEPEPAEPEVDNAFNGYDDSETVMDAILALDDLYKEGKLPESAYLERRAQLKKRLKQLIESEAQDR